MLSIHLGDYPGSIYDTETYFRNSYLDSWFEDPMAAQIIKSVDGSELIGPHNIVSKQLGSITPLELSGGVKTLLLVRNLPNMVFNASTCGDNCARWLLKIGKEQDVLVTLYHIMKFPWKGPIQSLPAFRSFTAAGPWRNRASPHRASLFISSGNLPDSNHYGILNKLTSLLYINLRFCKLFFNILKWIVSYML